MLTMLSVIVDYKFENIALFYTRGSPNVAGFGVIYSPTFLLDGLGCNYNALINALKN